jgi:hypothetical protein
MEDNNSIDLLSKKISFRAAYAADLLLRASLVAAMPDGYDDAGRQKMRMMTPDEAALRACEIAQAAFDEFEKRGWING